MGTVACCTVLMNHTFVTLQCNSIDVSTAHKSEKCILDQDISQHILFGKLEPEHLYN